MPNRRTPGVAARTRQSTALVVAGAVAAVAVLAALGALALTRGDDPERTSAVAAPSSPASMNPNLPSSSGALPTASPAPLSTATAAASASPAASARPVAVGRGLPSCNNGPCQVQHRLTRSFLPQHGGQQTLLLAKSENADSNGEFLHAFLVDRAGRVLWQEHGFGWEFYPVDEQFAIRFDQARHVFFRAYVADNTYLYVLDVSRPSPRLLGPNGRNGKEGFANGEIVEDPGEAAFAIRQVADDCSPEADTCDLTETLFRWNGSAYAEA